MKNILLVMIALSSMSLTACAVHTKEGSVVVDPGGTMRVKEMVDSAHQDKRRKVTVRTS